MIFTVNGEQVVIDPLPGEMLADLLRERLRLTGTKVACSEAECGACTVLVDGKPVLSCTYPANKIDGKQILTIEGLSSSNGWEDRTGDERDVSDDTNLHPLQKAFVLYGAVQCGFCIPGPIMTAYALLQTNPSPRRADIRAALKDTLCRCAGYPAIEGAILAAAESYRTGAPIRPPFTPESSRPGKVVGRVQMRPDAVEKVNGRAIYTDDLVFPGMLHARVRRALVPHALLRRLDTTAAKELPGVAAVLTAEDIPGERNHGLVVYDWPVLVGPPALPIFG